MYRDLLQKKLKIESQIWNNYKEKIHTYSYNNNTNIKSLLYLGIPCGSKEGIFITPAMSKDLAKLCIYPSALYYKQGIISLSNLDNTYFSLSSFDEYIKKRIELLKTDIIFNTWYTEIKEVLIIILLMIQDFLYIQNKELDFSLLIQERNSLYAQIACAFLPLEFLTQIKNPIGFLETTAPRLGQYILDNTCSH